MEETKNKESLFGKAAKYSLSAGLGLLIGSGLGFEFSKWRYLEYSAHVENNLSRENPVRPQTLSEHIGISILEKILCATCVFCGGAAGTITGILACYMTRYYKKNK